MFAMHGATHNCAHNHTVRMVYKQEPEQVNRRLVAATNRTPRLHNDLECVLHN